jgi:hypothetical protein
MSRARNLSPAQGSVKTCEGCGGDIPFAGHVGLWLFVALMLFLYFSQVNAPAPPGMRALEIVGVATWIFVPWMFWVDRNRELRRPAA